MTDMPPLKNIYSVGLFSISMWLYGYNLNRTRGYKRLMNEKFKSWNSNNFVQNILPKCVHQTVSIGRKLPTLKMY